MAVFLFVQKSMLHRQAVNVKTMTESYLRFLIYCSRSSFAGSAFRAVSIFDVTQTDGINLRSSLNFKVLCDKRNDL